MVRQGYLGKYVRPATIREYRPVAEETSDDHNRPTASVINIISGVLPGTDDPSPKKQRIEDVISFSENDVKMIQTPHNDAVIVSMMIVNYDIKRVLVDNRSSTDDCSMMLSQK